MRTYNMTHIEHTQSYYAATANPSTDRPSLQGDITCDVCIVGAGYTGLSTALHLSENGYKVVVLEGAKVGYGASGRNGGQIVNGYSRGYDKIKARYGEDTARALLNMSFDGGDIIRERIKKYKIQCDYQNEGTFFAAYTPAQLDDLLKEKALWESAGHDRLEIYSKDQMRDIVGTDVYFGGMRDYRGGHFHPLNLALGEADAVESLGGKIYEQSRVISIDRKSEKPVITTENGSVTADYAVVCGNAYMVAGDGADVVPDVTQKMMVVNTQIITTEVLGEERCKKLVPSDVCLEDCNYVLDYFRITADYRMLFGGGIVYGGFDPADIKTRLRENMLDVFPDLADAKIEHAWGGSMAFTFTRMPHVGKISDKIYFAHGYSGHGVNTSHLMGTLIGKAVQGDSEGFDVFASIKHIPFPGGKIFRVPLTAIGAWYYQFKEKLGL